jgi:hypothetical protein
MPSWYSMSASVISSHALHSSTFLTVLINPNQPSRATQVRAILTANSENGKTGILRIPMKSSMCSGHAVHLSERSDASKIIIPQVVGMGKGESVLRRDSPLRASRWAL